MRIEPIKLTGKYICLEPLSLDHAEALCEPALDEDIWALTTVRVTNLDEMRAYIQAALRGQDNGTMLPFVIVEALSGRPLGSTRYMNIDRDHRHVEIGSTWIGREWQRTSVNTEAKYMLLKHAFETLGCMRVEFKTDELNHRSRTALLRIGAVQEGIFRNHMLVPGPRVRNSVWFSVIDSEWPNVKAGLERKLSRPFRYES